MSSSSFRQLEHRVGARKFKSLMVTKMAGNINQRAPVSLGHCGKWDVETQRALAGRLIGSSVSNSTKSCYARHFRQWAKYRSANCRIPYLASWDADLEKGEDILLAYLALSVGSLNKDMSTTITHLRGVGHFRKLEVGPDPHYSYA